MNIIERILAGLTNVLTIAASGIAIYLYFTQKEKISNAFNTLLNYSRQLTLTELQSKLDRLNDLNANNAEHKPAVINILNEINGQIKGNSKLKETFSEILDDIEPYCSQKSTITEPNKRSIVSQIREKIRSYDVDSKNN